MENFSAWGRALERLRKKASLRSIETAGVMSIKQYKNTRVSKLGPSLDVLDRLLNHFKASWYDWAEAYEAVKNGAIKTKPHAFAAEAKPPYELLESTKKHIGSEGLDFELTHLPTFVLLEIETRVHKGCTMEELGEFLAEYSLKGLIPEAEIVMRQVRKKFPEFKAPPKTKGKRESNRAG